MLLARYGNATDGRVARNPVSQDVDSEGTAIDAPNVSIRADEDGADVTGPGVDIKTRRGN